MNELSEAARGRREQARHGDGRFGYQNHERVDLDLSWAAGFDEYEQESASALEEAQNLAWSAAKRARLAQLKSPTELAREVMQHARDFENEQKLSRTVEQVARSHGTGQRAASDEYQELAQDMAVSVLEAQNAGKITKLHKDGSVPVSYVRSTMRGAVSRRGPLNSRSLSGWAKLRSARAEREQKLGRELTGAELDALAHEIRMSIPVKNRPPEGFHKIPRVDSLEQLEESPDGGGASRGAQAASYSDVYGVEDEAEQAQHDYAAAFEQQVEERRITASDKTSSAMWDAFARMRGAPEVVPRSVSKAEADDALARVQAAGGAARLARAYERGEIAEAPGLFVPFGRLSQEEELHVAEQMVMIADRVGEDSVNDMFAKAVQSASVASRGKAHERVGRVLDELASSRSLRERLGLGGRR